MYKASLQKGQTAYSVRIVCGLLFIFFSIAFLYVQSPILEALQHVLSEGKTSYSTMWGIGVITVVLCFLQVFVSYLTRFAEFCHALSFLPSFLLLAYITDNNQSIYQPSQPSNWGWIWAIALVLYILLVWINKKWFYQLNNKINFPDLSARLWPNVLLFSLMAMLTLLFTNLNWAFHCETKVESLIRQEQFHKASMLGKENMETSHELTALRAYTLSRTDSLSECLFEYPQHYKSAGLFLDSKVQKTSMKASEIYNYLGDKPQNNESNLHYLSRICHTETGNHPALDYYLCALLLEKQLDSFTKELTTLYDIDETLPKHYKEALILYSHRHGEYEIPFDNTAMEGEYQQFLINPELYRKTYWWYYFNTPSSK